MRSGFIIEEMFGLQILSYAFPVISEWLLKFLERKLQHTTFSFSLGNILLGKCYKSKNK